MNDLICRIKYLLNGNFWAFLHYKKLGFTKLTYRGVPIILRKNMRDNIILSHKKDDSWMKLNIKTGKITTLKKYE